MPPKAKRARICSSCGTKLDDEDDICPSCGKEFKNGRKDPGSGKGKSSKSSKKTCQFCGQSIPKSAKTCPACDSDLSAPDELKKEPKVDIPQEKLEPVIEREPIRAVEAPGPKCSICGSPLKGGELTCPRCGVPLVPSNEPTQEIKAEPEVAIVPSEEEKTTQDEYTRPCPVCGSKIPSNLSICPVCKANLAEPVAEVKAVEAPTPARRQRRVKLSSAASPPEKASSEGLGRTNDVGKVNGLAMAGPKGAVNGTGAINGDSFVNGSGVTNGIGGQPRKGPVRKAPALSKWQFLAILVALIVIIPAFIFFTYSTGGKEFAADGDFSEWDGAVLHGAMISSTSPSTNVSEWAVEVRSPDVFAYLHTDSPMMSTNDAESYYVFVDADASETTGYSVGAIGADYLMQVTGWDSAVNSTSMSSYDSADLLNWSAWKPIGPCSYSLDGQRIEIGARIPGGIGASARFVAVSKDMMERGSVSYAAGPRGGTLIVTQVPSFEAETYGTLTRSSSAELLTLTFTCDGEGGDVTQVTPDISGASIAAEIPGFTLGVGDEYSVTVKVDISSATNSTVVSAQVQASDIASTFSNVQIIGAKASAYVDQPPSEIVIDGAFADWEGRLSSDVDSVPVTDRDLDIHEVGSANGTLTSSFYVSVQGEMCHGTFIPAIVSKPSGGGGGGAVVVLPRKTAEDTLNIFIDSDLSNSTGDVITVGSKVIGAEIKVEVKGIFGEITSTKEFSYLSGDWQYIGVVSAAKDEKRIEVGVTTASLGTSGAVDYIIETSSWEKSIDRATYNAATATSLTRSWVVDSSASALATSLSCQRKVFFDGTNFWSFYFDGSSTVYRNSMDGVTWSLPAKAFNTAGVNKVSIWFDERSTVVYAIGDIGLATSNVFMQRGVVDPAAQTITWSSTDYTLNVSSLAFGDKNTFISKDSSGFLWILSVNISGAVPPRIDLSTFKSAAVDDLSSWIFEGNLIGPGNNPNAKGSILPAGRGSDMWAIYGYAGNVASRKFTAAWSAENIISAAGTGNPLNTDNAPPSAVVDSNGVVHVAYGTSRKSGSASAPGIEYAHNNTDQTTFTPGLSLDTTMSSKVGDFYATISLDRSKGDLYVLWLRSDIALTPITMMGKVCNKGVWTDMAIKNPDTYTKQYLTSIYSAPDVARICWQWTQNVTAPIQVFFDGLLIPEFSGLEVVMGGLVVTFVATLAFSRRKQDSTGQ